MLNVLGHWYIMITRSEYRKNFDFKPIITYTILHQIYTKTGSALKDNNRLQNLKVALNQGLTVFEKYRKMGC